MTRDELTQLMLGDYQQITADEAQRAPITSQPVMGDLAAQAPSPNEIAAARVQRSVQPLGGRLEGAATELPWKLMTDPLKKAQGFIQAGMNTEQFPMQTMAPGSVMNVSTDYDPRRRMVDLGAETALNLTGMPMLGTAPAGSLGMGAARQAPGALAEQAPPFYSAVEQAVQASKQGTAPGQQWLGTLRNTPGVKPEEIETLGLGKLFEQPGSVSKQAVLDQIAANKVQVGERVSGSHPDSAKISALDERARFLEREGETQEAAAIRRQIAAWPPNPGFRPKFEQYTLPGGENYREMLLTLPYEKKGLQIREGETAVDALNRSHAETPAPFRSSHFDEPNVLAHVRTNDRVIDGKKTLFVEEVQSDWHQKGKRHGYGKGEDASWTSTGNERVPDAPFKTTWPELAMKRVIREAAEKGYDKVAWTPGSVQADRYDLSKQVNSIQITPRTDAVSGEKSRAALIKLPDGHAMSIGIGKDGIIDNVGASNQAMKGKRLDEVVGKDLADKIMATEGHATLSGLDLKVGGEGMKGFYDEILPATVNKLVKKHGGRVGTGNLKADNAPEEVVQHWAAIDPNHPLVKKNRMPVHTLDITPQLRKHALEKGFPYFTVGGASVMGGLAAQDQYQRQGGM